MQSIRSIATRTARQHLAKPTLITTSQPLQPLPLLLLLPRFTPTSRPFSSTPRTSLTNKSKWDSLKPVTYDELKPLTESPDDSVLLIDVREPDEVALGSIPSSVNLPLTGFEKSLGLDEGDFTKIHGFHKPRKDQAMIFYCRSGKRSETAIDLAKRAGFKKIRNYEGSYLDWQKNDAKNDD